MNLLSRFQAVEEKDKTKAVQAIVAQATPDFDFFFMTVLSVLMASFGLLANNETVVIGSMLLAPIMNPILSLSLGLAMSSTHVIQRATQTLVKSGIVALLASGSATILFAVGRFGENGLGEAIMSRTEPTLLYFAVALLAGLAVSYTAVKPHLSAMLPGVAVSVALMPPLAVVGIGLATLDIKVAAGAALMLLVNIAGIMFAGMVSFSLMDVHHKRYTAAKVISKEAKRIEKEEEHIEKVAEKLKEADEQITKTTTSTENSTDTEESLS